MAQKLASIYSLYCPTLKMKQNESQNVKKYRLNDRTYTGFIEFNKQNCGADFVKAFGAGLVDTQVYDSSGSTGLYTHVAQRGV